MEEYFTPSPIQVPPPHNPNEKTWKIVDGDDSWAVDYYDGMKWRPVRIVIGRWKCSNFAPSDDWNDFHGSMNGGSNIRYFNESCWHRPPTLRLLHQEEMNLAPVYGYERVVLMHDPVVEGSDVNRIRRLDLTLSSPDELPIIHIAVNSDDTGSNERAFDVFMKCEKFADDGGPRIVRYGNKGDIGSFNSMGSSGARRVSAGGVGACGDCAEEGDVNLILQWYAENRNNPLPITSFVGQRGYGTPISRAAVSSLPPTSFVLFVLPDTTLLRVPARIVDEILAYRRWRGVMVYPPI